MKKLVFIFILILAIPLLTVVDTRAEKGGVKNKTAIVTVKFSTDCHCVYVCSSKDLSNVVIEFRSCKTGLLEVVKIEDLEGYTGKFCVEEGHITRVWVKSGNNKSGDGPGYGQEFER